MAPPTLKELLTKALPFVQEQAVLSGYGNFPGGDPRDFSPDEECSTEEERAAHKAACESWARGEKTPVKPASECLPVEEARAVLAAGGVDSASIGGTVAHVTHTRFGLGIYDYRDPEVQALVDEINAALAAEDV